MSWKEQSEPESVIDGYAEHERTGLGPVSLQEVQSVLRAWTEKLILIISLSFTQPMRLSKPSLALLQPEPGSTHKRIEEELIPYRLSATEALHENHKGVKIGHTVVVMASVLKSCKCRF